MMSRGVSAPQPLREILKILGDDIPLRLRLQVGRLPGTIF
jgi:hypothetical protein